MFAFYLCSNDRVLAGTPVRKSLSLVGSSNNMCLKCGITKKSGKLSCCARGGAWFKKCGDVGDTKFEHTWTEGVDACIDFSNPISAVPLQEHVVRPLGTAHSQNATRHQRSTYDREGMSVIGTTDSKGRVKTSNIVVSTCALLIVSHLRL